MEVQLLRLLKLIEGLGGWLSVLAWLTVAGGAVIMAFVLRHEKRRSVWIIAFWVALIALTANLLDYFITLHRSPDLSLEANPLWRNVVDNFGLTIAKWYGFTGKIFVSIIAGQMFAFYLSNQKRLFPVNADSFGQFILRIGNSSKTLRQRFTALFSMFAFFFAGIQLLFFYIAYLNWFVDSSVHGKYPSVPVAIITLIIMLTITFLLVTYKSFKAFSGQSGN